MKINIYIAQEMTFFSSSWCKLPTEKGTIYINDNSALIMGTLAPGNITYEQGTKNIISGGVFVFQKASQELNIILYNTNQ